MNLQRLIDTFPAEELFELGQLIHIWQSNRALDSWRNGGLQTFQLKASPQGWNAIVKYDPIENLISLEEKVSFCNGFVDPNVITYDMSAFDTCLTDEGFGV